MERSRPFVAGQPIVWRSRPNGEVGYVLGCRVLVDARDVVALVQPTGAPVVRRTGARGGPNGRTLLPDTWDGSREQGTWDRPPVVRLHPVGRAYSVIRTWLSREQRFDGWYVNLEQPWARTAVGFDSRDDVLDVTVGDDLDGAALKDEDELDFAVQIGLFNPADARAIRSTAGEAIDDVAHRRWPFDESAWTGFRPVSDEPPPVLPTGWDVP